MSSKIDNILLQTFENYTKLFHTNIHGGQDHKQIDAQDHTTDKTPEHTTDQKSSQKTRNLPIPNLPIRNLPIPYQVRYIYAL